ncbi:uncharacterized protein cd8b [Nelusetta ayraudi]|uniref:uncharacterized protein cd8b n=1 Tax=Nelusetta ayraudi TaxID=303726 RepID=UPI003F72AF1E
MCLSRWGVTSSVRPRPCCCFFSPSHRLRHSDGRKRKPKKATAAAAAAAASPHDHLSSTWCETERRAHGEMPRPFAWTLWMVALWTSGWGLILQQNPPKVLYPELLSNYSIECHCGNFPCDSVFWYRFISGRSEVQYLGKSNHANRQVHGDKVDKNKFRFNARSNAIFTLTVISLTKEDTGTYSCFLGGRKFDEGKWNSGVLLLPGVLPPTPPPPPPTPKKKIKSVCNCPNKRSKDGCGPLILWPLVGLIAAITVALVCTLYHFSRLPKKCRHHFTKKRLMT